MLNYYAADLVVLIHFCFILFVILGGFIVIKWRQFIWLHLPAAVWGALIEFYGWVCPLTILENKLRQASGGSYSTGFIEHYIIPVIYPAGLTPDIQLLMGVAVVVVNLFVYTQIVKNLGKQEKDMTESALVSCEWLKQNLNAENQVILDATFFLPRQKRNAQLEYQQHIPGALFFDIDQVADLNNPLPHTLPNTKQFADEVGKMGIDNNMDIVIYDNNHFFAAARVWWMFRVFGYNKVRILDGGLARWTQLGFPLNSEQPVPVRTRFNAQYHPELVFDLKQMMSVQKTHSWQIVDARSTDSFLAQRPQVDKSLQAGHIPNSINLPYARLTDPEQQTLLPNKKLQSLFEETGIDLSKPIVTTCGSGVSAAVIVLVLYQLGRTEIPMYDGSWAEWGRQIDTPKQMKA